jgi:hypothetical protein
MRLLPSPQLLQLPLLSPSPVYFLFFVLDQIWTNIGPKFQRRKAVLLTTSDSAAFTASTTAGVFAGISAVATAAVVKEILLLALDQIWTIIGPILALKKDHLWATIGPTLLRSLWTDIGPSSGKN